jgi:hypothetical protein
VIHDMEHDTYTATTTGARCRAAARGGTRVGGSAGCRAQLGEAPVSGEATALAEERVTPAPESRVEGEGGRRHQHSGDGDDDGGAPENFDSLTSLLRNPPVSRF